ncbi:UNVERIFIED_CONTAM: hypothetical protein DVV65_16165, partial [Lactiplantibacillus plantarum]
PSSLSYGRLQTNTEVVESTIAHGTAQNYTDVSMSPASHKAIPLDQRRSEDALAEYVLKKVTETDVMVAFFAEGSTMSS